MDRIDEPARQTPVAGEYDVIVCGGGVAGIAAALSASRAGAKTLLFEREFALGGLATLGLVTIYLPLDDGCGKQVSFGIAEELLRLSVSHGAEGRYPAAWLDRNDPEERKAAPRFEVQYNAPLFADLSERILLEAGVRILYGAAVVGAACDGGKITHIVIEGKSGRQAYKAGAVVDTTGDADLTRITGERSATYRPANILAAWYYRLREGKLDLKMLGFAEDPDKTAEEQALSGAKRYTGLDTDGLSEMVCDAHEALLRDFLDDGELTDSHAIASSATIPQVRMTRRVVGLATLNEADNRKFCPGSVGLFSNWRKRGPAYELPFDTLRGAEIANLYFAGRCLSADDTIWDITRVIPVCAVSGEAAGLAAALRAESAEPVQKALLSRGVPLHLSEL